MPCDAFDLDMKSLVFYSLLLSICSGTQLLAQFTLSGTITSSPGYEHKLYIVRIDQIGLTAPVLIDSVLFNSSGSFSYTFEPDPLGILYQVILPMKNHTFRQAFSNLQHNYFLVVTQPENASLVVNASAANLYYSLQISGSAINRKLLAFHELKKPIGKLLQELGDSLRHHPDRADQVRRRYLPEYFTELEKLKSRLLAVLDTCRTTGLLAAGIYYLNEASLNQLKPEEITSYTPFLPDSEALLIQNLKQNKLAVAKSVRGMALPPVRLTNYTGKSISLSALRSTYKLLYFWASWCGPCRKANKTTLPSLKARLEQHSIPLIGVSIDQHAQKWREAVKADHTTWMQLHDEAALLKKTLALEGVPFYVVVDQNNVVLFESFLYFEVEQFLEKLL